MYILINIPGTVSWQLGQLAWNDRVSVTKSFDFQIVIWVISSFVSTHMSDPDHLEWSRSERARWRPFWHPDLKLQGCALRCFTDVCTCASSFSQNLNAPTEIRILQKFSLISLSAILLFLFISSDYFMRSENWFIKS